jgi:hypothetical protein
MPHPLGKALIFIFHGTKCKPKNSGIPGGSIKLGIDQRRQILNAFNHMRMPVFSPGRYRTRAAEHPYDSAAAGVAAFEHVRRSIPDFNDFMHTLDIQFLHCIKNHIRSRPAPLAGNTFNVHGAIHQAVSHPIQIEYLRFAFGASILDEDQSENSDLKPEKRELQQHGLAFFLLLFSNGLDVHLIIYFQVTPLSQTGIAATLKKIR